ncbi:MAG: tetratricopeptide repeat protein, partial [Candidatus Hodarchaeota archaeon]
GDFLFDLGDYEKAAENYSKAGELDASSFDTWLWNSHGNLLFDARKYDWAIKYYDNATKLDQTNDIAWRNRGLALYRKQDYKGAIHSCNNALMINPQAKDALNDKGVTLAILERYGEAIECYDAVIKIDPNYFFAWRNKGLALHNLNRFDEAIKCYNKAKQISPYTESWSDIIWSLYSSGNYQEAISASEKALETDPRIFKIWMLKGQAHEKLGDKETAALEYKQALRLADEALKTNQETPDNWVTKGEILQKLDNIPDAESCYKTALRLDPKNLNALHSLFLIYAEVKFDYSKALEISREVLKIVPNSFSAKANYSETLIKGEHYDEAREMLNSIADQAPDNIYQCIIRYYMFLSYLLEKYDPIINAKEFEKFLQFYLKQEKDFKIPETRWTFDGMIYAIIHGNRNFQTKFLATTIIDVLQGKIDKCNLSFLRDYLTQYARAQVFDGS